MFTIIYRYTCDHANGCAHRIDLSFGDTVQHSGTAERLHRAGWTIDHNTPGRIRYYCPQHRS